MHMSKFKDLVNAVRRGDEQATETLLRQFEAELRIVARVQLSSPGLRRVFDSMDIYQSVITQFYFRVASGQFDIETPQQLKSLLIQMLKNKVVDKVRHVQADIRDARRVEQTPVDDFELLEKSSSASSIASRKELLALIHSRLSAHEQWLVEQRLNGATWEDIGKDCGRSADAVRKQHARAISRVASEIGNERVG